MMGAATLGRSLRDAAISVLEKSVNCEHPKVELRLKTLSGGATAAYDQCLDCGASVGTAKKRPNHPIPPFCEESQRKGIAERQDYHRLVSERRAESYVDYLKTPDWAQKRAKVLERDAWRCQACLEAKAVQVHHRRYAKNLEDQPLFDLISVCRPCHEKIHEVTQ